MASVDLPSPDALEQQVHDCLVHLYDPAFLQDHPLVRQIAPHAAAADRVQSFREVVLDTIERLQPGEPAPLHSRKARSYHILTLRYIHEQSPQEAARLLALSERQFYREHRRAVQSVSRILWERIAAAPAEARPPEGAITLRSELQRAYAPGEQAPVDLEALFDGAIKATQSLAEQYRVVVETALSAEVPTLDTDPHILRQTVIWVLSQLMVQCTSGGHLRLACESTDKACVIRFELHAQEIAGADEAIFTQNETLGFLVDALGGFLTVAQPSPRSAQLTLALPQEQRLILVIDDNPDVVSLFRRYLIDRAYTVLGVGEGQKAVETARETQPHLIILDVMLPGQDGWEILQSLKNHPATRDTPVLVCSVLDAPQLAFSLGADAYLKKPPGQMDLLKALARWQA